MSWQYENNSAGNKNMPTELNDWEIQMATGDCIMTVWSVSPDTR